VYSVETDSDAVGEIAALPAVALVSYAELMARLEEAPWSGEVYSTQRQDEAMRTHPFGDGGAGLAIYLVLDGQQRVVVLRVLWAR
jgi:hypothetical protein